MIKSSVMTKSIVIAGKDKGKRGKVQKLLDDNRLLVSGVNMIKKAHQAQSADGCCWWHHRARGPDPGFQCGDLQPETNKADRVGFKVEDGKKVRIFKSTGEAIDA